MKTWMAVFSAVLAAVLVGAAALYAVRGKANDWDAVAESHNRRLVALADKLAAARGEAAGLAASELLMAEREARRHLESPPWLAETRALSFSCARAVVAIDEYRKAHGLGPLAAEDQ